MLAALHQVRVGVLRHREHLLQPRAGLLQRGAHQRLAGELATAAVFFMCARHEIRVPERPPPEHAPDGEAPVQNAARQPGGRSRRGLQRRLRRDGRAALLQVRPLHLVAVAQRDLGSLERTDRLGKVLLVLRDGQPVRARADTEVCERGAHGGRVAQSQAAQVAVKIHARRVPQQQNCVTEPPGGSNDVVWACAVHGKPP